MFQKKISFLNNFEYSLKIQKTLRNNQKTLK